MLERWFIAVIAVCMMAACTTQDVADTRLVRETSILVGSGGADGSGGSDADAGPLRARPQTETDTGGPPPADPVGEQPCQENRDCDSGFCVPSPDGMVCTRACVDDCPEGWTCRAVELGGDDATQICVSRDVNLCKPCETRDDCVVMGGSSADRCIELSSGEGSFCGRGCGTSDDCPSGFVCDEEVELPTGERTRQCVPETGACGCSAWAISSQATTSCGLGECVGRRSCTTDGLSECDAPDPEPELCDGADNDCDGATDEEFRDEAGAYAHREHCGACGRTCHGTFENGAAACDATGEAPECILDRCEEDHREVEPDLCRPEGEGQCAPCTSHDDCAGWLRCEDVGVGRFCVLPCEGAAPNACDDGYVCHGTAGTGAAGGGCLRTTGGCGVPGGPCELDGHCEDLDACTRDLCVEGRCVMEALVCDDGLSCTTDACDPERGCRTERVDDTCLVGDRCFTAGERSPADPCRVCSPARDPAEFSALAEGGSCADGDACDGDEVCDLDGACIPGTALDCDDGLGCTLDRCDPDAGCVHDIAASTCLIEGSCVDEGAARPGADGCSICDPATSPTAWSVGSSDRACDDGDPCTRDDVCSQGGCAGKPYVCDPGLPCLDGICDGEGGCDVELAEDRCLIDGVCHRHGDDNTEAACQRCDVTADPTRWTWGVLQPLDAPNAVMELTRVAGGGGARAGRHATVAADALGRPRLAWYDEDEHALAVADRTHGIWTTRTVDAEGGTDDAGLHPSMAFGSDGAWLVAYRAADDELRLAERPASTDVWTVSALRPTVHRGPVLITDAAGSAQIIFVDGDRQSVIVSERDATGAWVESVVSAEGRVGSALDAVADDAGWLHLVWTLHNGTWRYAVGRGAAWTVSAPAGGNVAASLSLVVDGFHPIGETRVYASSPGSSGTSRWTGSIGGRWFGGSFAQRGDAVRAVRGRDGDIVLTRDGGEWQVNGAALSPLAGDRSVLEAASTRDGTRLHVVLHDRESDDLIYATNPERRWSFEANLGSRTFGASAVYATDARGVCVLHRNGDRVQETCVVGTDQTWDTVVRENHQELSHVEVVDGRWASMVLGSSRPSGLLAAAHRDGGWTSQPLEATNLGYVASVLDLGDGRAALFACADDVTSGRSNPHVSIFEAGSWAALRSLRSEDEDLCFDTIDATRHDGGVVLALAGVPGASRRIRVARVDGLGAGSATLATPVEVPDTEDGAGAVTSAWRGRARSSCGVDAALSSPRRSLLAATSSRDGSACGATTGRAGPAGGRRAGSLRMEVGASGFGERTASRRAISRRVLPAAASRSSV